MTARSENKREEEMQAHMQLNKIKILFNLGEGKSDSRP